MKNILDWIRECSDCSLCENPVCAKGVDGKKCREGREEACYVKKGGGNLGEDFCPMWYRIICPPVACSYAQKLLVSQFGEEK